MLNTFFSNFLLDFNLFVLVTGTYFRRPFFFLDDDCHCLVSFDNLELQSVCYQAIGAVDLKLEDVHSNLNRVSNQFPFYKSCYTIFPRITELHFLKNMWLD